jgi:hypothetical protein
MINKIVIWGHELHSHTHSYIHNAFYKAFKHMGYETYWLSDTEENSAKMDYKNTFFIIHGLVAKYVPENDSSVYLVHNTDCLNYNNKVSFSENINQEEYKIPRKNVVSLQVYTKDCINRDIKDERYKNHYYLEPPYQYIYFPWATDLLPDEIDNNIKNIDSLPKTNEVNYVGMMFDCPELNGLINYCETNNLEFNHYGGTFNMNSELNKSLEENEKLIQGSIVAPAIQFDWQIKQNYIPCRIFKNISYGKMGVTNSSAVNELFDHKLIYSENVDELMDKATEFETLTDKNTIVKELMREVRDNHTYINRCNYVLEYLKKYMNVIICQ